MYKHAGLLSVGLILFSLGCSLVLDPEECTGSGDCENGQSCRSGICIGPVIPLVSVDEGVDARLDMTPDQGEVLPPDMEADAVVQPDMRDADRPPPQRPICEILEPAMDDVGPVAAERITVRGAVADPDTAAAALSVTLAGMPVVLDAEGRFETEVVLAEGPNTIALSAEDDTGLTCRVQVVVRVDRSAPVVEVTDPNGDVPVNPDDNPYRVSGTIEEEGGVQTVEVTVNDEPVAGPAAAAGAFGFPVTLAAGPNVVVISAVDRAGNRSAPVQRIITLDEEDPVVTIENPDDGTRTAANSVQVQGQVTSDGEGEFRSQLRVQVVGRTDPESHRADDEGRFDIRVPLAVGENLIRVEGNDLADNRGSAEVRVIREDPAPCVEIEDPVAGSFVSAAALEVEGTVCPAVDRVELRVDGGMPIAGEVNAGRFVATVQLTPGRRTVEVKAFTPANQFADAQVQVFYDNTGPTASINAPAIGACLNAAMIRVCGQVDDEESGIAEVLVNGTAAEVVGVDYCANLALPEGANQALRVVAENEAGLSIRVPALGQPAYTINVDRTPAVINLQNGDDLPWLRPDGAGEIVLRGNVDGGVCAALSARIERLCASDDPVDPACVAQPQEVGLQDNGAFTFRRAFPDGRQRGVLIRLTDTAGNPAERRYAFRVDGVAPTIVTVTEGRTTRTSPVQICLTARDPASGVQQIRIDDQDAALVPVGNDRQGCRDVALDEGENLIVVEALDLVGNRVAAEVSFILDTTAPQVSLTWPLEGGAVPTPALAEGTINDGPLGAGPGRVRVNGVLATIDRGAGTWRAGRIPIDPDDPVLVVQAEDAIGNEIEPLRRVVSVPDYVDIGAERAGVEGLSQISWLGITDANQDGLQDVIALSDRPGGVSGVFEQLADRRFSLHSAAEAGLPPGVIQAAALGDLDADGNLDLVLSAPAATGAYLGQGDGRFEVFNAGIPANVLADGVVLGDINRDGTLDLLLLAGAATRVQTNIGGRFNTQPLVDFGLAAVVDAQRGLFVDLTGDQVLDLITVGSAGSRLLRGSFAGPFQPVPEFESRPADFITVLDADRSGQLDSFTAAPGSARFHLANGGTFSTGLAGLDLRLDDRGLSAADLDGDAREDVVVFGGSGLRTYRGTAAGFVAADLGLPPVELPTFALAIVDLDADGDLDLVHAGPGGLGLITSNLAILQPDRLYTRIEARRGTEAADGPVDAVGVVISHEYAPGQLRLIPALPAAPTLVSLTGDDIEVQVRFVDLREQGGASRNLPALVAEPGIIFGPE